MTRLSPAESRVETKAAVRTAAWGLALFAATRLVAVVAASTSMASSVAQAVAAEYGAGRLGVAWSDPHRPLPTATQMARRAFTGAAFGAGAAGIVALFASVTRAALYEKPAGGAAWSLVAIGLITAMLNAMRDELLLHGVTLRALQSVEAPIARALACGVTSAAAAFGDPTTTPQLAGAHFFMGVALGTLWIKDRGAWMAWGAHVAWLFVMGTVLGGGALQTKNAANAWGGGDAGLLGGTAAVLALAPIAFFAVSRLRAVPPAGSNSPESKDSG